MWNQKKSDFIETSRLVVARGWEGKRRNTGQYRSKDTNSVTRRISCEDLMYSVMSTDNNMGLVIVYFKVVSEYSLSVLTMEMS